MPGDKGAKPPNSNNAGNTEKVTLEDRPKHRSLLPLGALNENISPLESREAGICRKGSATTEDKEGAWGVAR